MPARPPAYCLCVRLAQVADREPSESDLYEGKSDRGALLRPTLGHLRSRSDQPSSSSQVRRHGVAIAARSERERARREGGIAESEGA